MITLGSLESSFKCIILLGLSLALIAHFAGEKTRVQRAFRSQGHLASTNQSIWKWKMFLHTQTEIINKLINSLHFNSKLTLT